MMLLEIKNKIVSNDFLFGNRDNAMFLVFQPYLTFQRKQIATILLKPLPEV